MLPPRCVRAWRAAACASRGCRSCLRTRTAPPSAAPPAPRDGPGSPARDATAPPSSRRTLKQCFKLDIWLTVTELHMRFSGGICHCNCHGHYLWLGLAACTAGHDTNSCTVTGYTALHHNTLPATVLTADVRHLCRDVTISSDSTYTRTLTDSVEASFLNRNDKGLSFNISDEHFWTCFASHKT